jgi:hypothetical protein
VTGTTRRGSARQATSGCPEVPPVVNESKPVNLPGPCLPGTSEDSRAAPRPCLRPRAPTLVLRGSLREHLRMRASAVSQMHKKLDGIGKAMRRISASRLERAAEVRTRRLEPFVVAEIQLSTGSQKIWSCSVALRAPVLHFPIRRHGLPRCFTPFLLLRRIPEALILRCSRSEPRRTRVGTQHE